MSRPRPKQDDPISERSRALNAEIAALEAQIRDLGSQLESVASDRPPRPARVPAPRAPEEPHFEPVHHARVDRARPTGEDRAHYNELGARKFDLPGSLKKLRKPLRERTPSNPRLINYLAAGSIQGLRPLRYEKRVARNRVVALALLLLFVVWGLITVLRP